MIYVRDDEVPCTLVMIYQSGGYELRRIWLSATAEQIMSLMILNGTSPEGLIGVEICEIDHPDFTGERINCIFPVYRQ